MNNKQRKRIEEKESQTILTGIMTKSTSHDIHNPRHAPLNLWGHTNEEKFKAYSFNGKIITERTAVGFCYRHNLYLSLNDARKHHCMGKQCKYFAKNPNNEFWEKRAERNEARREAKRRRDDEIERLVQQARAINQQRKSKAV